ncbi:type 1 glutamine amidotransferase [Shewanella ulleungensis]|jgi:GMP synthase-like glutamine amidotransferase|uniref:type 1 glutamine amidotransferase n=1 Tax=Shewanella ulleungensis TaxID=2282699 RepID=UPI003D7A7D2E
MKIGILLCGDTPEPLQAEFGEYSACLEQQFSLKSSSSVSVWNVYQIHEFPQDVDACDVYIIGGSPAGVNDMDEWLEPLNQFIYKAFHARKKLFGICFGHQIINHALGGEIQKSDKGWGLGIYDVMLFTDLGELKQGEGLSLIAIHQDQVIKPAPDFEVVAGNVFCPNYITKYRDQVLTVQGHPEFTFPFMAALLKERQGKFSLEEIDRVLAQSVLLHDGERFNAVAKHFLFGH